MTTECILCGASGKPGLMLGGLQGEPFFCERCLFLLLMQHKPSELGQYCKNADIQDETRSPLAPENLWREGK